MEQTNPKKVNSPSAQANPAQGGSDPYLQGVAKKLGLLATSGKRDDSHVQQGIGFSGDDHHKGIAQDFAPPSNIANTRQGFKMMDDFAKEALASGKYKKVIWNGKNLVTGTAVEGHRDHVHISWG